MAKQKQKNASLLTVLTISALSFGSFAYTYSAVTGDHLLSMVQAKGGDDDGGGDDNSGEDDSNDDNGGDSNDDKGGSSKEKKSESEAVKKAKEAAKQKAEWQREQLKRKTETLRKTNERKFEVKHVENEAEDANDDHGDDGAEMENEIEGMDDNAPAKIAKHRTDALEHMSEDVIKTEERIARAQAEGIDVTKAQATLEAAKARLAAFEQSTDPMTKEDLRRSEREVKKLAYFASHKDVKSSEEMGKSVDKISKRISQAKGKLALYESLGGTSDSFKSSLAALESDFAALQAKIAAGGQEQIDAIAQLDSFERRVKSLKSAIEGAVYALGGTDQRYDDDYENEMEDVHEHLNDVAEIEGDEVGEQIHSVADAQKNSVDKVASSVENIDKRNRVLQALFGAKKADIENLESEITANKARIDVLNQAAGKIEDPEVKSILTEQISSLTEETSKLETFVTGQKSRLSAFGWFFHLFGN